MSLRPTALPAFGVFAVAARHQNFANAAEELGLTASAVSHQRPRKSPMSFRRCSKSSDSGKRADIQAAFQHARDFIERRVDASRVIIMARRRADC